jgi:hypothetical protein
MAPGQTAFVEIHPCMQLQEPRNMKAVTARHTLLVTLGIALVAAAVLLAYAGTYGFDAHAAAQPPQHSSMSVPF